MKLLAFGEILWDVYPDKKCLGGAPLNFAAHFALCGGESSIASAVGDDPLGEEAKRMVASYGVNTAYIATDRTCTTGRCDVTLDANAVPQYHLLDGVAYDRIPTDEIAGGYDVLYFGTLALRHRENVDALKRLIAREQFGDIFVDINLRAPYFSEETVRFATETATILKVSDEELPIFADLLGIGGEGEAFAEALCRAFPNLKAVILTLGENGALAYDAEAKATVRVPAEKVKVVSTVGAGDSFGAAYLYRYLCGDSMLSCLQAAAKRSGYVVAHKEAIPLD